MTSRKIQLGAKWAFWTTDDNSPSLQDLESIPVVDGLTFAADSWKPVSAEERATLAEYLRLNETDWLSYVSSNFLAKLKSQAMLFAAHDSNVAAAEDFTRKDVDLPRSYYLPVGEALFEGRWISAKNSYAYLKVVAKRIAKKWELEESKSLFDSEILPYSEELLSDNLLPDDGELSKIELHLTIDKVCLEAKLSSGATELLKARFYLGVTRRDAAEILGLSQAEVRKFWKEIQRKIPHLKKNLT